MKTFIILEYAFRVEKIFDYFKSRSISSYMNKTDIIQNQFNDL